MTRPMWRWERGGAEGPPRSSCSVGRDHLALARRGLLAAVCLGHFGGRGAEVDRDAAGDELGAADERVIIARVGVVGELADHDDRHASGEGVVGVLGSGTKGDHVLPNGGPVHPLARAAVELAVVDGDGEAQDGGLLVAAMVDSDVAPDGLVGFRG